jgi:two-component system cell cycle response regulator
MPETGMAMAENIAERVRSRVASEPFLIRNATAALDVTVSAGVTALAGADDAVMLLRRSDRALLRAKRDGRNRVAAEAA